MLIRKIATLVGIATVAWGMSSCDDGGKSGPECCTITYDGTTYRMCEGDMYDGQRLVGQYWTEFKQYVITYYGATCR